MDCIIVLVMMIQRSVKNQLIVDLVRPVPRSDFTSTRNVKRAGRLFIPDAVAIAIDSRLSSLALTLALGVSSGCEIANKFLILFYYCRYTALLQCHQQLPFFSAYKISMYFYVWRLLSLFSLTIFIKIPVSICQFFTHMIKMYSYIIIS